MEQKVCNRKEYYCHESKCETHGPTRAQILAQTPTTPTLSLKSALKYVLVHDVYICQLCRYPCFPIEGSVNLTISPSVDHILEARHGGKLTVNNIRLAHRFCNSARAEFPNPRQHPRFQRKVAEKIIAILEGQIAA